MLKEGVLMVELWTLQLIRNCLSCTSLIGYCILEETSHEIYCWIGVDYAVVGLILLKESEISAPQPRRFEKQQISRCMGISPSLISSRDGKQEITSKASFYLLNSRE
ncbi:hypothetical protein P3S68_015507 [Capsicum galapagoense]